MQEILQAEHDKKHNGEMLLEGVEVIEISDPVLTDLSDSQSSSAFNREPVFLRQELLDIRDLLYIAA